jgi:hypothetical protein
MKNTGRVLSPRDCELNFSMADDGGLDMKISSLNGENANKGVGSKNTFSNKEKNNN